jgi:fibronectin-binding autotransporter adhesin
VTLANQVQLAGNTTLHSLTNNSTLNGVISGTGSLTKDGSGSVTLNGANTYSGGTNINAGKAIISQNASLGVGQATFATGTELETAAGVTLANQVQLAGNTTLHSLTNNSTLNGVISGTGSLTKDGSGSVTLNGANTYSGGTNINAGKAIISQDASLGVGQATFATGTALTTAAGVTVSNLINLAGDATLHSSTHDSSLNGVISGAGSLTKDGGGSVSLNGANTYSGGTNINAGTAIISKDNSFGTGQATFATGTALTTAAGVTVSNLINLAGDATLHSSTHDSSLNGVISGAGSLTKDGSGSVSLNGANTYSGGTNINAGKAIISQDATR